MAVAVNKIDKYLEPGSLEKKQYLTINYHEDLYEAIIIAIHPNCLLIELSLADSETPALENGENVTYSVGVGSELLQCQSMIIGTKVEDRRIIYVLNTPIMILKREDRRQFYRAQLELPAEYKIIPITRYKRIIDVPKELYLEMTEVTTADLSGGGVRLKTNLALEPETMAVIKLNVPSPTYLLATVVRSEMDGSIMTTSFKFEGVTDYERDIIIHYIFSNALRKTKK